MRRRRREQSEWESGVVRVGSGWMGAQRFGEPLEGLLVAIDPHKLDLIVETLDGPKSGRRSRPHLSGRGAGRIGRGYGFGCAGLLFGSKR